MAHEGSQRGAAFDAFYLAHYSSVVRTTYLVVHDRAMAEDLAQDAFVQLYVHWPKVAAYEQPQAWVRRVAIRLAVRAVRRNRHAADLAGLATSNPPPAPERDMDLLRAVATLPAAQRAAVVLYYYEDLPVADVADALGRSQGAVKLLLHRARRTLGAMLEAAEANDG